jgi:hypothetical protein
MGTRLYERSGIRKDPTRGERGRESRAKLDGRSPTKSIPIVAITKRGKKRNRIVYWDILERFL